MRKERNEDKTLHSREKIKRTKYCIFPIDTYINACKCTGERAKHTGTDYITFAAESNTLG